MIHHGPIGLHAVVIYLAFGHPGFLHQIDDEPVLLAGDAVTVALSIGGTIVDILTVVVIAAFIPIAKSALSRPRGIRLILRMMMLILLGRSLSPGIRLDVLPGTVGHVLQVLREKF